jgi:predicted acyl esterase
VKSIDEISDKQQSSTNLHLGSVGILRASHRAIDEEKSIHPQFPFHPHTRQEKVPAGEIVKLEIGIWAAGVNFDAGETISIRVSLCFGRLGCLFVNCLQVSGQYPSIAEYKTWSKPRPEHELNRGKHFIHVGGEYPSSVILPFI